MAAAYTITIILALFTGAMPTQILGIIWEQISEGMGIEIPYIAILRLIGASGAIIAVVLSDRIRGYILARDLIVLATSLEAMSLIGFSMSREFWNIAVWILALGFSAGLSLSLICYLLREVSSGKAGLLFAFSACGIAAGAAVTEYILDIGHSWRAACQTIAIIQIVLCLTIFFLRRTVMKDVAALIRQQRREAEVSRARRREKLIREKGSVDERSEDAILMRLMFLYGAALCCGMLLLSAIHLTFSAQVSEGEGSFRLIYSILMVCGGMAAGRVLMFLLKKNGRGAWCFGTIVLLVCLGACTGAALAGFRGQALYAAMRIGTGFGAGMIFPNMIQVEDERFDKDAQTAMAGLIPAFYLGTDALITPFVQSMSGSPKTVICASAMFVLSCCMGVCLAFASSRVKRGRP